MKIFITIFQEITIFMCFLVLLFLPASLRLDFLSYISKSKLHKD